jgi:hypothetical protein
MGDMTGIELYAHGEPEPVRITTRQGDAEQGSYNPVWAQAVSGTMNSIISAMKVAGIMEDGPDIPATFPRSRSALPAVPSGRIPWTFSDWNNLYILTSSEIAYRKMLEAFDPEAPLWEVSTPRPARRIAIQASLDIWNWAVSFVSGRGRNRKTRLILRLRRIISSESE